MLQWITIREHLVPINSNLPILLEEDNDYSLTSYLAEHKKKLKWKRIITNLLELLIIEPILNNSAVMKKKKSFPGDKIIRSLPIRWCFLMIFWVLFKLLHNFPTNFLGERLQLSNWRYCFDKKKKFMYLQKFYVFPCVSYVGFTGFCKKYFFRDRKISLCF